MNIEYKNFLKVIETYIKEKNIRGVFVGHEGGSDLVAGDKTIVKLIQENSSVSSQDILNKAKELTEADEQGQIEFDTWRGKNIFPPLPCDPTSKSWDYEARRSYLRLMFNRLGFYKGSFLNMRESSHCPDGFPTTLSWSAFGAKGGPNGTNKKDADKIIQSFLEFYMPDKKMTEYFKGF